LEWRRHFHAYLHNRIHLKGSIHDLGWLIRRGLDWMIGFIAPYTFTQVESTGNITLSLFYTLSVHRCTRTGVLSLH
jgi:hypothetical protein